MAANLKPICSVFLLSAAVLLAPAFAMGSTYGECAYGASTYGDGCAESAPPSSSSSRRNGGSGTVIAAPGSDSPAPSASGFTDTQKQSILGLLASFGADSATIANVTAALNGTATAGAPASSAFVRDLDLAYRGEDVRQLQIYLNTHGYPVALSAEGSLGQETDYFGALTQTALAKYQAASGITPAAGYFGPITRAYIAAH